MLKLRCPGCGVPDLRRTESAYVCRDCQATFPIVDRIARFVPTEAYSASFGYQWNRFARTQLDSANGSTQSRDAFVEKTGWSLDRLRGRRVLDAGCGMGRFAEVCADAGTEVHAVDLSRAVDAAAANLSHRDNVHLYQADIMSLPFPERGFDFVYSLGVLHHTPDTRAAFHRLVPLVKEGGSIAIWVYSAELRLLGSSLLRPLTSRLPKPWLLAAARIAVPLYYVHRIRLIGLLTQIALPTSLHPDAEWRWLDTFDWYAPRYQWKHAYDEVEGWFREAGLADVRRGPFPVSVSGVRPG